MFLQRHKSRIIAAAALFATFIGIGGAAHSACGVERAAVAEELSLPRLVASGLSEAVPEIISEETVTVVPVEPEEEVHKTAIGLRGAAAPKAPVIEYTPPASGEGHLTYYEHGHFQPGENGILITAEGEELRYSSVIEVSATAYTTERQENKITATGTVAHVGGIAVDPKVIPYGTKMYIVSKAGAWAYGYAVAEDCGGGIKGNKVDLFLDTYDECIQFGVRKALVYIIEE